MLAIWSYDLTYFACNSFLSMHFHMKWYRVSICLLRSWKIRFLAKAIADLLSMKIFVGYSCGKPNSFNKFLSKIAWQILDIVATYLASQIQSVTICCFFDIHVKQNPHKEHKSCSVCALSTIYISTSIAIAISNKLIVFRKWV